MLYLSCPSPCQVSAKGQKHLMLNGSLPQPHSIPRCQAYAPMRRTWTSCLSWNPCRSSKDSEPVPLSPRALHTETLGANAEPKQDSVLQPQYCSSTTGHFTDERIVYIYQGVSKTVDFAQCLLSLVGGKYGTFRKGQQLVKNTMNLKSLERVHNLSLLYVLLIICGYTSAVIPELLEALNTHS